MQEHLSGPAAIQSLFEEAAQFDPTLEITSRDHARLQDTCVRPDAFSRDRLYTAMLQAEPCLLSGYSYPVQPAYRHLDHDAVCDTIMHSFATSKARQTHRVFTGPTGVNRNLTLPQISEKWLRNSTRFGVTDLHIRESALEKIIAPDEISAFNLLCRSSWDAQTQEMFSYVISSYGHVTDSHSDAPDSTNYCFTGKKLWLAWDTYEGARAGLQDVERVPVSTTARFDMQTFLTLPSARWAVVEAGQTLFLPANLTHKVVTLGRYIGVGGFYIALPNCLKLMAHWILHGPLWSRKDKTGECDFVLSDIADTIQETILAAPTMSLEEREALAFDYLIPSARHFIETCPPQDMAELWSDPRFRQIAAVINLPWPLPKDELAA